MGKGTKSDGLWEYNLVVNVKNKIAIVTGASSGIGRATAILLSSKGAKVVLASRNQKELEKLSGQLKDSIVVPTNVTDNKQLDNLVVQTVKNFGKIDILINNAGRGYDALIEKIEDEKFFELFRLNLLAPLHLMQKIIPIMQKNGGGSIVNISSGTSLMEIPTVGAYSGLKRALNGISFTAREELFRDNIKVSVVYPFITDTNFYKNIIGQPRKALDIRRDKNVTPPDSSEFVAEKILLAITTGDKEIFAHDWMKKVQ